MMLGHFSVSCMLMDFSGFTNFRAQKQQQMVTLTFDPFQSTLDIMERAAKFISELKASYEQVVTEKGDPVLGESDTVGEAWLMGHVLLWAALFVLG